MAAYPADGRCEGPGALVTEKVVLRDDVVDLEAIGAGITLADVALKECLAGNKVGPFAVTQKTGARGPAAGLTRGGGRVHGDVGVDPDSLPYRPG